MHLSGKKYLFLILFNSLACIHLHSQQAPVIPFDTGWRFFKGGVENGESAKIDDSHWRIVDLPHDWSIEDLPGTHTPFDSDAISQVGGGFTIGGTGWYRKNFVLPANEKGKRTLIIFEGVYMNADVWINGHHLGNHPYGYTSFWFDLTDYIKYATQNILAIQVKNEGQNSRWYTGSGINRHVWMKFSKAVHIAEWGTFISCQNVSSGQAGVEIKSLIENSSDHDVTISVETKIVSSNGTEVARTYAETEIKAKAQWQTEQKAEIKNPELWSVEAPVLYRAVSVVRTGNETWDVAETKFGIRNISIDAQEGFLLNGNPLKLKGGCYHNDNGPLGSRSFDRAEERRVELMKASGYNAIRCSHNPPAPAFLDACDRLGMLVIDEAFDMWKEGKNPYDYHLYFKEWWKQDIQSMVMRDRNHPSVIMWSIGNEIPGKEKPEVANDAREIATYIRQLDPTRSITSAVNDVKDDKDGYFSSLDVAGYNYAVNKYAEDHKRLPERVMMGTESYALEAFEYWMAVTDHPYVIGDFIWTGFDYIGEASIGWRGYPQEKNFYPWNLAFCGDIDICGWKRPQSYYRDVLWKPDQLSIFVKPPEPSFPLNPHISEWSKWNWYDHNADWNWQGFENKTLDVIVYSSCEEAELFLNGKSLGKKATGRDQKFMGSWNLPYKPGILKAIGYRNGKQANISELRTAGKPVSMKLSADRTLLHSNGQDLCYVTVELVDVNGIRNPKANNSIAFSILGPASITAVGNANPISLESFQVPRRRAWQGRCMVILNSSTTSGKIILKAHADGLPDASLMIDSR